MDSDREAVAKRLEAFGVDPTVAQSMANVVLQCLRARWSSPEAVGRSLATPIGDRGATERDMTDALRAAMG